MYEASVNTVDLRRYQRIVVPEGVGIRVSGRTGGSALTGIVSVIGLGGMFCRTTETQPPGTVMTLLLACPGLSLEIDCTIRHVNEYGMGIEFTGFTPENRLELAKLLLQLRAHVVSP
jgi:hypothetical protein